MKKTNCNRKKAIICICASLILWTLGGYAILSSPDGNHAADLLRSGSDASGKAIFAAGPADTVIHYLNFNPEKIDFIRTSEPNDINDVPTWKEMAEDTYFMIFIDASDSMNSNNIAAVNGAAELFVEHLTDEIYQVKAPYSRENLHVLLSLDTTRTDMTVPGINRTDGDFALSWIKNYGEGRVFYLALGHEKPIYWNPELMAHLLAGIQWAVGDLEVPKVH